MAMLPFRVQLLYLVGVAVSILLAGCGGGSGPSSATTVTTTTTRATLATTTTTAANFVSVRVAKALGSRGYSKVRVSVVRDSASSKSLLQAGEGIAWTYNSQFKNRWTQWFLSSAVVDITPGETNVLNVDGTEIKVRMPKQGEGSIGMLIGDPCTSLSAIGCQYADAFATKETMQQVLNSLSAHSELDYWILIGDLFYDQSGKATADFFSGLTTNTSASVVGATLGNHDFWIMGSPGGKVQSQDSFGNGHMQWYAQDAMSAKDDGAKPFDFSADPAQKQIVDASNTFWYYMVGNVALVGFSNAYGWSVVEPLFAEACKWASNVNPALFVLLGHWDGPNMGCTQGMDTPDVYAQVSKLPGCANLGNRIKWVEGHTHCNQIVTPNIGFKLGAFGFQGCGHYGIPLLDTRNGSAKLYYYELSLGGGLRVNNWDAILDCLRLNGHTGCVHLAKLWMNEPLFDSSLFNTVVDV